LSVNKITQKVLDNVHLGKKGLGTMNNRLDSGGELYSDLETG